MIRIKSIALGAFLLAVSGCAGPPGTIGVGLTNADNQSHTFHVAISEGQDVVYEEDLELGPVDQRGVTRLDPGSYRFVVAMEQFTAEGNYTLTPGHTVQISYNTVHGLTIGMQEVESF